MNNSSCHFIRHIAAGAAVILTGATLMAAPAEKPAPAAKLVPTHANVSYGSHPNQLMDVYLPPAGPNPSPVLLWFGTLGKPSKHQEGASTLLPKNIAVIAVQTRTLADAEEAKIDPPISVCLLDAQRAVQFARLNAAKWNLDPKRVAVGGSSQAGLPALFVACGGEQANPKSADPVERMSTKVIAAGCNNPGACLSMDPKRAREWVPEVNWGFNVWGCTFEEALARREELLPKIKRWSPDWLAGKKSPPIYLSYSSGLIRPDSAKEQPYYIHSPKFGLGFQAVARKNGATCYVNFPGHPSEEYSNVWEFLISQLTASADQSGTAAKNKRNGGKE